MTTTTSTRPTTPLLATLAVLALLAVGCSTDDDAGAPAPTTEAGTDDPTAPTGPGGAPEGTLERYAGYETVHYDDPARWLCRPDATDFCDEDLDATVVEADGTLTVEPFEVADDAPVDCFYVYPTISRDDTATSDWDPSPDEEGYVVQNQAARLGSACRVFAPVYRQQTLTALLARMGGGDVPEADEDVDPFEDVLDAFRTYMATDNQGRGVVLIGHSQGANMLNRLIATEVDPNPDVREKLVAAYLAGWNVAVPEGADVGGDFDEVPLCRSETETGCVVTWVSFRATAPPAEGAFFGGARSGAGADQPEDLVAGCTNPAALEGGEVALDAYFPADADASILSTLDADGAAGSWVDPTVGEVTTPYVAVPGLVRGQCTSEGGFTYLSVTVDADPDGPRADDIGGDLTPEWGLHLVDVNLVMGDIVRLVAAQAEAWAG